MIRTLAAACAALALAVPALAQTDYPSQDRHDDRAVPARRRGRHHRPPGGRGHGPPPQADRRRREQGRRRRRRGHAVRRARQARRLHGAARALVDLDHPGGRQDPRARPDVPARPARSHRALHRRPDRARGARRQPVEEREGHARGGAKAPGAIPYGSSGNYGTMHVPMEMLTGAAGAKMLHVPVHGRRPRGRGAARRQRRRALHGTVDDHGPPEGRQGARARELGRHPPPRAARRARRSRSWATTRSSRSGPGSSSPRARRSR